MRRSGGLVLALLGLLLVLGTQPFLRTTRTTNASWACARPVTTLFGAAPDVDVGATPRRVADYVHVGDREPGEAADRCRAYAAGELGLGVVLLAAPALVVLSRRRSAA